MPRIPLPSRLPLLLCLVACLSGCSLLLPDLVEQRRFERLEGVRRIAVVPFATHPRLTTGESATAPTAWDAATLVTRFMTEALSERGVDVVPETDVRLAFEGHGQVVPREVPEVTAILAASDFAADAVLLGEVRRYREREGSAYGSMAPASVDFQVTLYSTPDATRLWTAHFDQTQGSISGNPFQSSRYPGGGTRFLTVAELAKFGAQQIAEALPLEP